MSQSWPPGQGCRRHIMPLWLWFSLAPPPASAEVLIETPLLIGDCLLGRAPAYFNGAVNKPSAVVELGWRQALGSAAGRLLSHSPAGEGEGKPVLVLLCREAAAAFNDPFK